MLTVSPLWAPISSVCKMATILRTRGCSEKLVSPQPVGLHEVTFTLTPRFWWLHASTCAKPYLSAQSLRARFWKFLVSSVLRNL